MAPIPPPALIRPFAVPSFPLNHCTGILLLAVHKKEQPNPTSAPAVQKRPPRLSRVRLASIGPRLKSSVAVTHVYRAPNILIRRTEIRPKVTIHANATLPTNDSVHTSTVRYDDLSMAACRTPHVARYPLDQKRKREQTNTIVHP